MVNLKTFKEGLIKLFLIKEAKHKRACITRFHLYEVSRTDRSLETESRRGVAGTGEVLEEWVVTL